MLASVGWFPENQSIVRGTTEAPYSIDSNFATRWWPLELVTNLSTRWNCWHLLQILPPFALFAKGGANCISLILGGATCIGYTVAPLACTYVDNLAITWLAPLIGRVPQFCFFLSLVHLGIIIGRKIVWAACLDTKWSKNCKISIDSNEEWKIQISTYCSQWVRVNE